jgi:D-alanyl-D-alanine carboxypeptidase
LTRVRLAILLLAVVALPLSPSALNAAPSSLVIDMASGRTLHAFNADQRRYPASLTKMMTLYLLFDAIDRGELGLNSRLRVSRRAAAQPPTKLGLLPGRTIRVRDAILALATQSANDVAVVVAEALAGSEGTFAVRMTAKARSLGMQRTTFRNASGLHNPQQQTTARDMALLGRALLSDHAAHYRRTFATRAFSYGQSLYRNHNRLLGVYKGMDGIKTGYTRMAGFNLVASAKRGDRRVVGVVMGSRTGSMRNALMVELLDRGFRQVPQAVATSSTEPVRHAANASSRQRKIAARTQVRRSVASLAARAGSAEAQRRAAPKSPARLNAKARIAETAKVAARSPTAASPKQRKGKAVVVLGAR